MTLLAVSAVLRGDRWFTVLCVVLAVLFAGVAGLAFKAWRSP